MNYIPQPNGSHLCGQACVAMLTDKSLEKAIALVGTKGKTSLNGNIRRALVRTGIVIKGEARLRKESVLPEFCLIRMRFSHQVGGRTSHLIIHRKGIIYDPGMGIYKLQEYKESFPGAKFNYCLILDEKGEIS